MKILVVNLEKDYRHLAHLKKGLAAIFKCEVESLRQYMPVSHSHFNLDRQQWNAKALLQDLDKQLAPDRRAHFRVLALFPYDIYVKPYNFVFGLSEAGGASLLSYYRLDPRNHHGAGNDELIQERILKEAIHELSHSMGLDHCQDKRCVMSYSPNELFVDRKTSKFCADCARLA